MVKIRGDAMPRRPRCWREDACYHITHRCHGRDFLLKFAKHRDLYLNLLRDAVKSFRLEVLDYMVTSNHIHLLLHTPRGAQTSSALQYVHGRIAQDYNIAKGREAPSGRIASTPRAYSPAKI